MGVSPQTKVFGAILANPNGITLSEISTVTRLPEGEVRAIALRLQQDGKAQESAGVLIPSSKRLEKFIQ